MAKGVRPITSLLKQGVKFVFTPSMEVIVRKLPEELSVPPAFYTLTGARSPTSLDLPRDEELFAL